MISLGMIIINYFLGVRILKELRIVGILFFSFTLLFGCATNHEEGAMADRRDNPIQNVGHERNDVNPLNYVTIFYY